MSRGIIYTTVALAILATFAVRLHVQWWIEYQEEKIEEIMNEKREVKYTRVERFR